ncbi:hypothetical protein JIQ42_04248 [Leishmania sp. Namibia]|uniref:hypothetical protein n=1 Tax=Leishmania sp. Namibia TaxID=2802991 RepID=UPI001B613EFB|nr:hypothetical protein JIQ42_04248 [Leishmania sp. Namibia]
MKGVTAGTNALAAPEAHAHQLLTAPRVALLLKEALLVKDGLAGVSRTSFLEVVHLHDFVLRLLCEARLTALARRLRVKVPRGERHHCVAADAAGAGGACARGGCRLRRSERGVAVKRGAQRERS